MLSKEIDIELRAQLQELLQNKVDARIIGAWTQQDPGQNAQEEIETINLNRDLEVSPDSYYDVEERKNKYPLPSLMK